ncbi:unnamed protein product, partial [Amoebophrya sp. A25]
PLDPNQQQYDDLTAELKIIEGDFAIVAKQFETLQQEIQRQAGGLASPGQEKQAQELQQKAGKME